MKRITVTMTGRYRPATTTLRAALTKGMGDHPEFLSISRRAFRAAEQQCCYAGDDYGILEPVPGFRRWNRTPAGDWIAWAEGREVRA